MNPLNSMSSSGSLNGSVDNTSTGGSESVESMKEKAERLIHQADIVHDSNLKTSKKKREMLLADSSDGGVGGSSRRSTSFSELDAPSSSNDVDTQSERPKRNSAIMRRSNSSAADSSSSTSTRRKSRFQTVSELKQQLQDVRQALVDMQENASVKYRKLELEFVDLKAQLSTTKSDLDSSRQQVQQLAQARDTLQHSLEKSLGRDKADWFQQLEQTTSNLQKECSLLRIERDELKRDVDVMHKAMVYCSRCKHKLPDHRHPDNHNNNATNAPATLERSISSGTAATAATTSFWESVRGAMFNLGSEATSTTTDTPTTPAQQITKVQSQRIKDDLEADIEEMEQQMKNEIEHLKAEWTKPPSKSSRKKKKKHERRGSGSSVISFGGVGGLENFLKDATAGLEHEEMNEEMSLFSKSRSVSSAPANSSRHRRKSKKSRKRSKEDRRSDLGKGFSERLQEGFDHLSEESSVAPQNSISVTQHPIVEEENDEEAAVATVSTKEEEQPAQVEWGTEARQPVSFL